LSSILKTVDTAIGCEVRRGTLSQSSSDWALKHCRLACCLCNNLESGRWLWYTIGLSVLHYRHTTQSDILQPPPVLDSNSTPLKASNLIKVTNVPWQTVIYQSYQTK